MDQLALLASLRDRPTDFVPFVGAGLAVAAGAPRVDELASELARASGVTDGPLAEVCADAEARVGRLVVQQLTAEVLKALELTPTETLVALARWPSSRILTTNYDDAIEVAVAAAGLVADPVYDIRTVSALRPVEAGHVQVIHVHGHVSAPDGIVLPGMSTALLSSDDPRQTHLRALLQRYCAVFLGFGLGAEEFAIRNVLAWLAAIPDAGPHILLLPEDEVASRGRELAALGSLTHFEVVAYESDPQYRIVGEVARAAVPRSDPAGTEAQIVFAEAPVPYVWPSIVPEADHDDLERLESKAMGAEGGWGDPFVATEQLAFEDAALVVAGFGMGKTELARVSVIESARPALLVSLKGFAARLVDESDPGRALARTIADGHAGRAGVPSPSLADLKHGSYLLVLDGLDEVPAGRREAAAEAITLARREWTGHRWLVTSRPCVEVTTLVGFSRFRILPTVAWTRAYFLALGVPDERAKRVRAEHGDFGRLLGIPLMAALVGQRLMDEAELPTSPLELIVEAQAEAVRREARTHGRDAEDLDSWLQRLALALEIGGRSHVDVLELAAVPGRGDLAPLDIRERLVRATLLADLPGVAAFARRTLQEVLCAWAILRSPRPAQTVQQVATAEVAGERHPRTDMAFTLDLIFESADRGLRAELREIDEMRWARTVVANGTLADARVALDLLIEQHDRHQVAFLLWSDGLRSSRGAVTEIVDRWPQLVDERLPETTADLSSPSAHLRHNALWLLRARSQAAGGDEATSILKSRLPTIIGDDDEAVANLAADTALTLELRAAMPQLRAAASDPRRRGRVHLARGLIGLAR